MGAAVEARCGGPQHGRMTDRGMPTSSLARQRKRQAAAVMGRQQMLKTSC